jgi:biopolymer transport protein TolR
MDSWRPKKRGYITDINLTPLVDVVFVLLIIFMVTAPMMTEGVEVDLPETREVSELPATDESIVLTVKKDGSISLEEYDVELEKLAEHLERLVTKQKKALFLRADAEVPYGRVVKVMGEIKAAGIDKLGMIAERDEDEK